MFGSGVLDTVIGLMFVFLLVSVLVTTTNEFISAILRSRAKWLEYGIHRMIGSKWAEALFRHPLIEGTTMEWEPQSNLTLLQRLMSLFSKVDPQSDKTLGANGTEQTTAAAELRWRGAGPSYIPSRTFANVLMALLQDHQGIFLKTSRTLRGQLDVASAGADSVDKIKQAVNQWKTQILQVPHCAVEAGIGADLAQLSENLGTSAARPGGDYSVGDAIADVQQFINGIPPSDLRQLILSLPDKDQRLRTTLLTLFDDAANDVEKFKQNIEVWFNNSMDRVGGWYKRRAQWVVGAISLVVVVLMNVDAMLIVRYLDANPGVRNGLVTQAKAYVDAKKEPVPPKDSVVAGDVHTGTLTFDKPVAKDSKVVFSSTAPGAIFRPASLRFDHDASSVDYALDTAVSDQARKAKVTATVGDAEAGTDSVDIEPSYPAQIARVQKQLTDLKLPIGWSRNPNQADADMHLGLPTTGDAIRDALSYHWLGWLIVAIAASLGAPFWFDMLNKVISIRSAGKSPDEKRKSPEVVQAPMAPGQSPKEASRDATIAAAGGH